MPKAKGEWKVCSKCGETKNVSEFHKDKRTGDGYKCWCQECRYEKLNKPTKYGIPRSSKEYNRVHHLDITYGLSLEDWHELLDKQNGVCAICGESFDKLCVDHDHKTGQVRGLLCDKCNKGLGQFNDDVNKLARAIQYLAGGY